MCINIELRHAVGQQGGPDPIPAVVLEHSLGAVCGL